MVVGGHRLDDTVAPPELSGHGLAESAECVGEFGTPFRAPADRTAKGNVRSGAPQRAGLAMVVITACDDAPVDVQDQLGGNRLASRQPAQPAVGRVGCPQLPLRMSQSGRRGNVAGEGLVLLAWGELGALDARCADCLQSQLLLMGLLDPLREVRQAVQDAGGGLGLDQQPGYGRAVVAQPLLGDGVTADAGGGHVQLISGPFRVRFVISLVK